MISLILYILLINNPSGNFLFFTAYFYAATLYVGIIKLKGFKIRIVTTIIIVIYIISSVDGNHDTDFI